MFVPERTDDMKPPRGVLIVAPCCMDPEIISVIVRIVPKVPATVPLIPPTNTQKSSVDDKLTMGVFHSVLCGIIDTLVFVFEYTMNMDTVVPLKESGADIQLGFALKYFNLTTSLIPLLEFVVKYANSLPIIKGT